ncbi:hypothetical protein ACFV6G_00455 [Streptomyces lavendulae]|uniref:hypothetical protein n=1 Tax=Streptomyces lavendulae TaxID=1914 RepID=UPI0036B1D5F1
MSNELGTVGQASAVADLTQAVQEGAFHRLAPEPGVFAGFDSSTGTEERALEGLKPP